MTDAALALLVIVTGAFAVAFTVALARARIAGGPRGWASAGQLAAIVVLLAATVIAYHDTLTVVVVVVFAVLAMSAAPHVAEARHRERLGT